MSIKKSTLLLLCVLLLSIFASGCDVTPTMAVEQAKDMIAKQLKDPESAQFQNVVFRETEVISETHFGSICGEVNAKNSFGGYTGYKRFTSKFSYTNDGSFNAYGTTIESTDSDPFFNDEWNNNCK